MNIYYLAIGDELLRGESREGNGVVLAEFLSKRALELSELRVLPDDPDLILQTLRKLCGETAMVVVSGGLGPTDDDRTRDAVADACGVSLVEDSTTLGRLKKWSELRGRALDPANLKQAQFPANARILANRGGTAPGFAVQLDQAQVLCFPGVPSEFRDMIHEHLPDALNEAGLTPRMAPEITFRIFGITESGLQSLIAGIPGYSQIGMRSLPKFPEIRLVLSAENNSEHLGQFAKDVRAKLGWRIFSEHPTQPYAATLLEALETHDQTLAVAESCSGGLISKMLTEIPGASRSFMAGVVSYSNESKTSFLDVPKPVLVEYGAVSGPTAMAMAEGIRARSGASIGVAVTGIAGPGGGTPEKPVGTFYVGLATATGANANAHIFPGLDRLRFQRLVAYVALNTVQSHLSGSEPG